MYFRTGSWDKRTFQNLRDEPHEIAIGAKARFDGYLYEVMGFVVKQESTYHYQWREYLIFNPLRGYAFLSEYNGHWNLIWPIEVDPRANPSDQDFYFEGEHFQLYQRYSAHVIFAKGEFFFDVVDMTANTVNYEYIAPPYLLEREESEDSVLWCKGEYLTRDEVSKAFSIPLSQLPSKKGAGYTQPFSKKFSDQAIILCTVLVISVMIFLQIVLTNSAEEKVVFHALYDRNELKDQKILVTPSFELKGTRSLEIRLFAPLSNDWFFSEFTLVNETDGTEYNFTKEVEYYSGYEDGTSWTEGSKNGDAFLSQIPEGKYHLNIYPEFSFNGHEFEIWVVHDVPVQVNFYLTCIAVLLYPAFYFIRRHHREKRRWADSDYSPYHTE
jgi:hypothetical protein